MTLLITSPTPTAPATTVKEIVTLHPDTDVSMQLALLDAIEETLRDQGVDRIWIDRASTQLVVVAEVRAA
ncbi:MULTISPECIES: hypothetical protein [unclassified Nocardioides]|uniref:hypothetical protein n=1 Tax=unclassified Nocardioides TaxID=2615069 RepID=UPI003612C2E0